MFIIVTSARTYSKPFTAFPDEIPRTYTLASVAADPVVRLARRHVARYTERMTLEIAAPAPIQALFRAGYEMEGQTITVVVGHTDARVTLAIEGPAPGEFVFLALHPAAFAALGHALVEYQASLTARQETAHAAE